MKLKSVTPITKANGHIFKVIFEHDKTQSLEVTVTAEQLLDYRNFQRVVLFRTGKLYLNYYLDRQPWEKVKTAWCEELDVFLSSNHVGIINRESPKIIHG